MMMYEKSWIILLHSQISPFIALPSRRIHTSPHDLHRRNYAHNSQQREWIATPQLVNGIWRSCCFQRPCFFSRTLLQSKLQHLFQPEGSSGTGQKRIKSFAGVHFSSFRLRAGAACLWGVGSGEWRCNPNGVFGKLCRRGKNGGKRAVGLR
jgi:hypothetical protein